MSEKNKLKQELQKKEKIKIGIDIDDVLVDTAPLIVDFVNTKEKSNFNINHSSEFGLWNIFNCSKEECVRKVYEFYNSEFFKNSIPYDVAVSSVNFLSDDFDLFAITSRDEKIKSETGNFINKYFSDKFKEILFTNQFSGEGIVKSKAQICVELGINLLIEDRRKYALDCAKQGIKVFLMDKPWNQNCEHENITRVKNWNEILEKLNKLKIVENELS